MVLQAGLAALLTRLGAGHDIPIGSPVAGRGDHALDDLVGFFVNTLVLRTDTSGNPGFRDLVARVRTGNLAAYGHQELPFERLVEVINPARSLSHHPLFQVMLAFQNDAQVSLELPGLRTAFEEVPVASAKFDLSFALAEERAADGTPSGINGVLEYAGDLFEEASAATLAERLTRLLTAAVAEPTRAIGSLDILSAAERRTILTDWNDTARAVPDATMPELFARQAARTPDAIALVYEDRDPELPRARCSAPTSSPTTCARSAPAPRPSWASASSAPSTWSSPSSVSSRPAPPTCRSIRTIPKSACTTCWRRRGCASCSTHSLAASKGRRPTTRRTVDLDVDRLDTTRAANDCTTRSIDSRSPRLPHLHVRLDRTAQRRRRSRMAASLNNRIAWMQDAYRLTPDDAVLQKTPFSFRCVGLGVLLAADDGARLVIAASAARTAIRPSCVETIRKQHVTTLHFVPSMLQAFFAYGEAHRCDSIRQSASAAAKRSRPRRRVRLQDRYPRARLENLYGPTEASIDVDALVVSRR